MHIGSVSYRISKGSRLAESRPTDGSSVLMNRFGLSLSVPIPPWTSIATLRPVASPPVSRLQTSASAHLPNRRFDHGVVQSQSAEWVSFNSP